MADDVTQEITTLLGAIRDGDEPASARLFPLVYDELRRMARQRMASERNNHTLQATALVHEAYLRLVESEMRQDSDWTSRRHFFGAAAEAMRRILVENARRKQSQKHGGARKRISLEESDVTFVHEIGPEDLLALDDALNKLSKHDTTASDLIKLRIFGGLSVGQAAQAVGISQSKAYTDLEYARAWLCAEMGDTKL